MLSVRIRQHGKRIFLFCVQFLLQKQSDADIALSSMNYLRFRDLRVIWASSLTVQI